MTKRSSQIHEWHTKFWKDIRNHFVSSGSKPHDEKQKNLKEQIAYQLYQNRLKLGKVEDANSDWEEAEKILNSRVKRSLFAMHQPFIAWLTWAENQAWLRLLEIIGFTGIFFGLLAYVGSEKQRRDAEIFTAWQTITNASEQPGNGGRIKALEFLNASRGSNWRWRLLMLPRFCTVEQRYFRKSPRIWFLCFTWPPESLAGIDLSVKNEIPSNIYTYEPGSRVYLRDINLEYADLELANLQYVDFWEGNLQGANLRGADLRYTFLQVVNFQQADLSGADLEGARLGGAYLTNADLTSANLTGVDLGGAILLGTQLSNNSLEIVAANKALLCATTFGGQIRSESNRDCNKLAEILFDRSVNSLQLHIPKFRTIDEAQRYVDAVKQEKDDV